MKRLLILAAVAALSTNAATALADTGFEDVESDHTFAADIDWLASAGITRGCNPPDNDRFCPDEQVTRGQMAAFLNRALGLSSGSSGFSDTVGHVFAADVAALADAGITRGCNPPDNDRFCPDEQVTRGQMAAFLNRALELSSGHVVFDDTAGHVFADDVAALADAGITRGCNPPDNDLFCPDAPVTRSQMAAFLHRAADLISGGVDDDPTEPHQPNPLEVLTSALPDTTVLADYRVPLETTGGALPITWEIVDGPEFLSVDPAGELAGIPETVGSHEVSLTARDSAGQTDTVHLSVIVEPAEGCEANTEVPAAECAGLVALYHAADGPGWQNATNWLAGEPCEWYGVECSAGGPIEVSSHEETGHVSRISLSGNWLDGTVPSEVGYLPELRELVLDENDLHDVDWEAVSNLSYLRNLDLTYNLLSGELPDSIGGLQSLNGLYLARNELSGDLPAAIGNLTGLREISLERNQFTGPVPAEWSSLELVSRIDLAENQLTGIDVDFGPMQELYYLDLADNQIEGGIPGSIFEPPDLRFLYLNDNQLTGSLPDSVEGASSLFGFEADGNQLGGLLPSGFLEENLPELTSLYLRDNHPDGFTATPRVVTFVTSLDSEAVVAPIN